MRRRCSDRLAGACGPHLLGGVTLTLALALLGPPARADCEEDLKALAPRVQELKDPATQRHAQKFLVRALRELDEGDELDCLPAADAVRQFLLKAAQ